MKDFPQNLKLGGITPVFKKDYLFKNMFFLEFQKYLKGRCRTKSLVILINFYHCIFVAIGKDVAHNKFLITLEKWRISFDFKSYSRAVLNGFTKTAWKMSKYGVFSGPHFLVFGLNTDIYSANLRIQSEYRKTGTRKNSVFGHFSRRSRVSIK